MHPRSAKRRNRKTKKLGLRILQSGVAVSVLVLYASNQIGSTYGGFSTSQEQSSSIGLCAVFPGEIERLLTELGGHLRTLSELKASLHSYSPSGVYHSSFNTEGMSFQELDQTAEDVSAELLQADSEVTALAAQLSFNTEIWLKILQEIGRVAAILHQLGGYMQSLDPGCLEIRDDQFFGQIQESLQSSGILSESMNETLNGVMHYLNSIHDLGGSLPTGNPDRVLLLQDAPGFRATEPVPGVIAAVYSNDSGVAPELQATYSQLNTELTAAKDSLASTISTLQMKQSEIAEAQAALKAKADEEEKRLALEKAQAKEAADKAQQAAEEQKAKESEPGSSLPSPAPSSTPPQAAPPEEEASAAQPDPNSGAGEQPNPAQTAAPEPEADTPVPPAATATPEPLLPDGNSPASGSPAVTPAPVSSPVPSPAPLSDISKGGD